MATLKKVTTVVWKDEAGNRVKPHTPGGTSHTIESAKYYIVTKVNGRVKRIPAYTDKKASQAKLADWLKAHERGEAGLTDPHKKYYDRPILDHVKDYHAHVQAHLRSEKHAAEVHRILKTVVAATKIQSIREITPAAITKYLIGMTQAAATRNMHRRIMVMFANWLEGQGCLPTNPIGGKKVKTFKPKGAEEKRKRRALTADELQRLLVTAREQPLKDVSRSRGGRPRKDGSKPAPPRPPQLTPETIRAKVMEGKGRHLLYRLAVFTGLRRGELSRLQVRHLSLNSDSPKVHLPGRFTKNGQDAIIPLPPSVSAEVLSWIEETGKTSNDPVVHVPDESNLSKMHQRLLQAAGIKYTDERGRYADFHALRYTANVLLRIAGIPLKDRMVFLRHESAALTDGTYEDEEQIDRIGILEAFRKNAV